MIARSSHLVVGATVVLCGIGLACDAGPSSGQLARNNAGGPESDAQAIVKISRADVAGATKSAEQFTDTVKAINDVAGFIANLYGTYQAAQAIGQYFGFFQQQDHDVLVQLQMLQSQIDQVAAAVTWFESETAREARLTDLRQDISTTNDDINAGRPVDWFTLDMQNGERVGEGTDPTAFERKYIDADTGPAGQGWKAYIPYTQADLFNVNGFVYDWRLGLPALMQLIALRLQLMAMEDANFTTDSRFHDELMGYHDALISHIQKLNAGLRCKSISDTSGSQGVFEVVCADIYSGLNEFTALNWYPVSKYTCSSRDESGALVWDYDCLDRYYADFNSWVAANEPPLEDQVRSDVRALTPWFAVQALADTVFIYANGDTEVTTFDSAIHSLGDYTKCLDVFGASTDPHTTVELYACNGNPASQSWRFDRANHAMIETWSGLCLEVQNASAVKGTPLWTANCNGSPEQQWSYDWDTKIFTNMLGNVLVVPNNNFQSLQPLATTTRDSNFNLGQLWM